ncbi:hypothetical protein J1N35_000842 [Gossypium stocksii]|uniref:MULE transposase domain-containing protein n=1 Tax=Gossypium stocksii TaxID=47602 RepID=A0A9D3WIU8_9ROSI|nr:hypothetical protein J1N35_000842 [Gossypium stocksii]
MYKTNKYDLHFVQIVGVTSTNKTFSIAFASIINEKEKNYNWALTCLKLTLEECMYPRVIVTDRLLLDFMALEALNILEGELQRSNRHQLDSSNCGCKLRHSCECISLDSIDVFWRKLDLSPLTSVENKDICCDDELLSSYDVYARVFTDGINELRNSLCFSQSPVPAEHWMVMPMTGVLIANRFGVILSYLTKRGDITFFPLWRGPKHFQYHHAITITHVYNNHNVMVQLEGDYPMPTISAYWIRHRASSTAG